MSASDSSDVAPDTEAIRTEVEATRVDLAHTVDALSAKLDVKARAADKAGEVKQTIIDAAAKAKPYRAQVLAAAAGAVTVVLLVRRTRRSG